MVSDLYWQLFKNDGSAYYYVKYTEALKKEGKICDDTRQIYGGCIGNKGAADR